MLLFDPKEMEAICVFHGGSLSATIESLRGAIKMPGTENKELLETVVPKLSGMKSGDDVSLAFDSE